MSEIRVFVSYCRRDELWVNEGEFGLIPWLAKSLARRGVEIWFDRALRELPGEDFRTKIQEEIDQAQFAILLISQEFLNSGFIREYEMPRIKARVDRGEMTTIPILVDHTLWEYEDELKWITDRQMLPGTPKPLIDFTTELPEWRRVRAEILRAILHRVQEHTKRVSEPAGEPTARESSPKPPVRAAPRAEPRPVPQLDEGEPPGVAASSEPETRGEVIQEGLAGLTDCPAQSPAGDSAGGGGTVSIGSKERGDKQHCPHCRQAVKPDVIAGRVFCSNCGKPWRQENEATLQPLQGSIADWTRREVRCPHCGTLGSPAVVAGEPFCSECGVRLQRDPAITPEGAPSAVSDAPCPACGSTGRVSLPRGTYCEDCGQELDS